MPGFVWTIPLWPLVGWLVLGLAGGRLPRRAVGPIACGTVALAFAAAVAAFATLPDGGPVKRAFFTWIAAGSFAAEAALLIDPLAVVMALVVTGVGLLIHVYSVGYMADDPAYSRYFAYLNLFTGSMLLLVLSGNLLVLFVGWELVGLCSYLLIGFWFDRERAATSGRKAFVVNRIGDAGFLLGVVMLALHFGTLDLQTMLGRPSGAAGAAPPMLALLLLFVGATGKSAQLPLYTWLPDAMEGPTPVSALIHAATMVTAGVYLIARLAPLFALHESVLAIVGVVGAVTALFAATIALREQDLKRVLAYSTISQLGYMFTALGVAAPGAAVFHLVTHAFFKALLFLAAGSVMHAMQNVIDLRRLGGLARPLRATATMFLIGGLALAGVPPLAGFFSKDLILEAAWEAMAAGRSPVPFGLALLTAFITAVYITRAALHAFFGPASDPQAHPHESPLSMLWPMGVLAGLTVLGGLLGVSGGEPLTRFLGMRLGEESHGAGAAVLIPALSIAAAGSGILLGWMLYSGKRDPDLGALGPVLRRHWFVLDLYDGLLVPAAKRIAFALAGPFDLGLIDRAVNGLGGAMTATASVLRRVQTGYLRQYAAVLLVGTLLVMIFWLAR